MSAIRIATRASDLALWQARQVGVAIERALGVSTEIVAMKTTGDRTRGSLAKVGGKGLFVKEIEEALLEARAEVAVHSAKDLPAQEHPDLVLAAFPKRADPRDALVARDPGATLRSLPRGARVGTGSLRRTAQLLRVRPDLDVVPLRGNVPTRIGKVDDGELAAVVLACAGLDRLDHGARISERIAPSVLLPAVAQGALAVQTRRDAALAHELEALTDPATATCVRAERAFLCEIGGDCNAPLAAFATLEDGVLSLEGRVLSPDGREQARATGGGVASDASRIGAQVARAVLADGGRRILDALAAQQAVDA